MATNTTDRSRFLLNITSLNNVITSASGPRADNIQTASASGATNILFNTNAIKPYSGNNITIGGNLNLSNSAIYFNSNLGLTSNAVNGIGYLVFQTNGSERMRLVNSSFGIGVKAPLAALDVGGSEILRGNLYVSSFGNGSLSANIYTDGTIYCSSLVIQGLNVASDAAFQGNVTIGGTLNVPNQYTFTRDLVVTGTTITNSISVSTTSYVGQLVVAPSQVFADTAVDVYGSTILRGSVEVFGSTFIHGGITASAFITASDIELKTNITPYLSKGLPQPVRFTWKDSGADDIGVIAQDVFAVEPACVQQQGEVKYVDYSKLTVLCLAELHSLKSTVAELQRLTHGS